MQALKLVWKWLRWPLAILIVAYVALVLYRIPAVGEQQKTAAAIQEIQSQKVTLSDVMGTNLPPKPYEPENDATVAGIDKNNNGVRDDVELAIFAKYPLDPKIRAAELQYALAEQVLITNVFNTDTWKAGATLYSRADGCISNSVEKNEVDILLLNTQARKDAQNNAFKFTTSLALPSKNFCDIDLSSLTN